MHTYTEAKIEFVEQGLSDHQAAQRCQDVEEIIGDVNNLFHAIIRMDEDARLLIVDGVEQPEDFVAKAEVLARRWLPIAVECVRYGEQLVSQGYAVVGLSELKHGVTEATSFLNPSYVLNPGAAALLDAARAEYARGEFTPGLVD